MTQQARRCELESVIREGQKLMAQYSSRPLLEPLEDRRYAASVPLAGVRVSLDGHRALHVVTTDGEDGIRIRGLPNGYTQVDVVSTQTLPSADTVLAAALPQVVVDREQVFAADPGKQVIDRRGDTVIISRRYTVQTRWYVNIAVDGGGAHDVLKLADLPVNPILAGVERTVLAQTPAPAGQTPSDSVVGGHYGPRTSWGREAARQKVRAEASGAKVAFIGDSHAAFFLTYGRRDWLATFGDALNLGLPGDGTRQLLARIQGGLFDTYKPRKLIVMIGANNFNSPAAGGTDEQIYKGVVSVIAALREKLPHAKLVLVGVLPQREAGVNARVQTLNTRMARRATVGGEFAYYNPFNAFVGDPARDDLVRFDDHLTSKGYARLTNLLAEFLAAI